MDKIFEAETEEYLLLAGIPQKEIDKIKFIKGKEGVLKLLQTIVSLIEQDKFEVVMNFIAYSPSGDDMGCDNYYIDFSSIFTTEKDTMDIQNVCQILSELKEKV